MNSLIQMATGVVACFLSSKLPELSPDYWQKHVLERLSFQQQRTAQERGLETLQQLDFAALLRVLDQNWYELSGLRPVAREARTWVKELQIVRNKWAHLSTEAMPASEIYRDVDTLGRLLATLGATQSALDTVDAAKAKALAAMSPGNSQPTTKPPTTAASVTSEAASPTGALFKAGDLVALRSAPNILSPVMEVIPGGAEHRYRVF